MRLIAELEAHKPMGEDEESEEATLRLFTQEDDDHVLRLEIDTKGNDPSIVVVDRDDMLDALARLFGQAFSEAVPKQEASL